METQPNPIKMDDLGGFSNPYFWFNIQMSGFFNKIQ